MKAKKTTTILAASLLAAALYVTPAFSGGSPPPPPTNKEIIEICRTIAANPDTDPNCFGLCVAWNKACLVDGNASDNACAIRLEKFIEACFGDQNGDA